MTQRNNGGPAYPGGVNQVYTSIEQGEPTQPGMPLRDYFAAKVMQGTCALSEASELSDDQIAKIAYRVADAMLKIRSL